MPTRNLTIMFTDIKGFTARTSRETRHGIVSYIEKHNSLLLPVIKHYHGTVVKTIGDAFLVHFDSPTDGVLCGLTIQEVLRQHNAKAEPDERVLVRVAINVGDVELKDNDVLGEPVNIAARLEGITEAGDVYFTEAVYLAMNRKEVPSTEVGERTFQGISHAVRIFKVTHDPDSDQAKKIAQSVEWKAGAPVFQETRGGLAGSATASSSAYKPNQPVMIALFVAVPLILILILGVGASLIGSKTLPKGSEDKVLMVTETRADEPSKQARGLLDSGEPLAAFETASKAILEHPADQKLRQIAVEGARQHFAHLLKTKPKTEAIAWLRPEFDKKRYLEPLESELAVVDTEVHVWETLRKRGSGSGMWEGIREILNRYPKNPDVPYAAAQTLRKTIIIEALIWLYAESIKRGHAADENIFSACVETFARNLYSDSDCKDAHELAAKHYDKERVEWAGKALDAIPKKYTDKEEEEKGDFSVTNALAILKEKNAPRGAEPFYASLMAAVDNKAGEDARKQITETDNEKQARQALDVLRACVNRTSFSVDRKDQLKVLIAALERKWDKKF